MFTAIANLSYGVKQAIVIAAALFLSALIAYLTTPAAIRIAKRFNAVDVPADGRRMHKAPVPLLGGLSIIAGFVLTAFLLMRYHRLLWQMVPGALIIVTMGIIDDRHPLPALPKLFVQCVAAAIPIAVNPGLVVDSVAGLPLLGPARIAFGAFAVPVTILWIVGITNAVNLIDGLDGLAAGVSAISSVSILAVAVIRIHAEPNQYGVAILAAALAGGCIGLIPYNKNPAKVFMGDTGATFLGYTLAVISIEGLFKTYTAVSVAVPLLTLAVPILDTLVAVIRRLIAHKSPFTPDRSHIHHKLIDLGLDQRQSVTLLYAVSAVLGTAAIIFAACDSSAGWLFLLAAAGLLTIFCVLIIPQLRHRVEKDRDASRKPGDAPKNSENSRSKKT